MSYALRVTRFALEAATQRATRNAQRATSPLSHVALIAGAVAMLLPFVWMISTSLKPADQLFTVPPTWVPRTLQWDTYARAMRGQQLVPCRGKYVDECRFVGAGRLRVCAVALSGAQRAFHPGAGDADGALPGNDHSAVRHHPPHAAVRRQRYPRPGRDRLDQLVLGVDRTGRGGRLWHLHAPPVLPDAAGGAGGRS